MAQKFEEIRWVFLPTYDFSSYTSSELDEIKRVQPLELYAEEQLTKEREHIFERARNFDKVKNRAIVAIPRTEGMDIVRYVCLEDALRHLLYGVCGMGYVNRNLYVLSNDVIWLLQSIPNVERVHIKDEFKYNKEYLEYIVKNDVVDKINIAWYDGNKDKNIETKIDLEKEREREH